MKATLLKTSKQPSKYGGDFYYLFFKGEDGKPYKTCLSPKCGNFRRWQGLIAKTNIVLDKLMLKGQSLIDADSFPVEVKP